MTTAETTEQFAERIVGLLDSASAAILISIGHQTGLFDAMADLPPSTSAQLAHAAGLNERYVREWLGGMVVGRIIEFDAKTVTYSLPPQRAAALTRAAGPDNLARVTQFIPLLAEVEQRVIDCFRTGGGHSINVMAEAFPASRFTGIDFSDEGLAVGTAEAQTLGLTNARFEAHDVAAMDVTDAYHVVTAFDAIHDQADPAAVLRNIYAALRPGGVFLMVDIKASSRLEDNVGVPFAAYLYTVSTLHCMSVSLAFDGAGLGTVWGRQLATSMLDDAGFRDVTVQEIDTDPINYYYVGRK